MNLLKAKTHNLLAGLTALLFAIAIAGSPSVLHAQAQAQPPGAQPNAQQQHSQAFHGKIMQLHSGTFALMTGHGPQGQPEGHFMDSKTKAKKYVGQKVTVVGTLNMATNTIHVQAIRPQ